MTVIPLDTPLTRWEDLKAAVLRCRNEGCTSENIRARDLALADYLESYEQARRRA